MAVQISIGRERFKYYSGFYFTTMFICTAGFIKTKKPQILAPLVPLSFAWAFQYDLYYGDMMERAMK